MTWRFDWITSWDEIWSDSFIAQWYEWMQTSPTAHVFFHPTLVRVWVDTYMPLRRMEPRFLVATQDGCTVFLPMVYWRRNWKNAFQRLLIPVGYSDYDYHDPIIVGESNSYVWRQFWGEVLQDVWKVGRSEYDAIQLPGIHETLAHSNKFVDQGEFCPWHDLTNFKDGEAFLKSLSKSLRHHIRRQERRMSEIGKIAYTVFSIDDLSEAIDTLGEFLKVHAERWPAAYKAPGFHHNLVKYGLPAGVVHLSVLKVGGDVAAWRLDFVDTRRFYAYMPVYRPEYAKLSAGKILEYYCIRDAIRRRLKAFDHLRGDESYKAAWTNQVERLYTLRFENRALSSRLRNVAADRVKPILVKALVR